MKKLLFLGSAIFLLAAGCNSSQPAADNSQTQNPVAQQSPATTQPTTAPAGQPTATGQGVSTVSTNNGSVAGVDLSEFGTEANQSSSMSAQDGAADAQTMSSDGSTINSSANSVNNPIQ